MCRGTENNSDTLRCMDRIACYCILVQLGCSKYREINFDQINLLNAISSFCLFIRLWLSLLVYIQLSTCETWDYRQNAFLGGLSKESYPYLREFRRKPRKTPNG